MAYIPTKKSDFDARLAPLLPDYSHAPPNAQITKLLQTNAPPAPIERKSLEAALSEAPDRIAELDTFILSTTSLLRYLTNDRNQALENQANAQKILSPSRRLPAELLTDIFIRCSSLRDRSDSPLDPGAFPWTLSHVCRKWREVAIATPELWSSIHLNFEDDRFLNGSRKREAAFMLGVILDRARPHDLDISIYSDNDISMHPAGAVLLPSARYWKSFSVLGNTDFLSPCRGFFDRLQTAIVCNDRHGRSNSVDTFTVAPRLRSFKKGSDAPFSLPDHLVEFEDFDSFNENTCTTLRHLVNVETLTLSCSSYSSELPKIHLPRLSHLQLRTSGQTASPAFLTYSHFDLPSLTHITLLFSYEELLLDLAINVIHSSTVTSLSLIWPSSLSRKYLASNIQPHLSSQFVLPNLRCLTIESCPYINAFLGELSVGPRMSMIFPQVSKLDIISGHDLDFSEDALNMHILVELIQSRRDQGALREFKMKWERGLVKDDADTCSRWQQLSGPGGGIQISASIKGQRLSFALSTSFHETLFDPQDRAHSTYL
ncbi:hypothetical protein EDD18DRAFT_1364099 [Armillaria luteobubalina]|uniref:F-box domain-containing protein n=1 Tax=Armillaria luteobubalina TaxID=153913 RepID=A0AA39UI61_9AGAR|nr:hypothetical protein EDD18DRAFT_1364099 [Armillaria luteobubalina]